MQAGTWRCRQPISRTRTRPDRKFDAARALSTSVASQLTALDGFGTFTPIRIRFSRPMVVDAGENPQGILLLEYDDLNARPALISATAYAPDPSIEVQPIRAAQAEDDVRGGGHH